MRKKTAAGCRRPVLRRSRQKQFAHESACVGSTEDHLLRLNKFRSRKITGTRSGARSCNRHLPQSPQDASAHAHPIAAPPGLESPPPQAKLQSRSASKLLHRAATHAHRPHMPPVNVILIRREHHCLTIRAGSRMLHFKRTRVSSAACPHSPALDKVLPSIRLPRKDEMRPSAPQSSWWSATTSWKDTSLSSCARQISAPCLSQHRPRESTRQSRTMRLEVNP